MSNIADDTICPFCQTDNQCMAHSETPCWCQNIKVPEELIALLPDNSRGKLCICRCCVELFIENPVQFKKKHMHY